MKALRFSSVITAIVFAVCLSSCSKTFWSKGLLASINERKEDKVAEQIAALQNQLPETTADSSSESGKVAGHLQPIDITDPQYEWSQYENKLGKALITDKGLVLVSKSPLVCAMSVVELPIAADESEFTFGATFIGGKLDNDKSIGLVFNYRNELNYMIFQVSKKGFYIAEVKDGIISVSKRGLVKTSSDANQLLMKYKGGKLSFTLQFLGPKEPHSTLEVTECNNISITSPMLGVSANGKIKTRVVNFVFNIPEGTSQTEESTSNT